MNSSLPVSSASSSECLTDPNSSNGSTSFVTEGAYNCTLGSYQGERNILTSLNSPMFPTPSPPGQQQQNSSSSSPLPPYHQLRQNSPYAPMFNSSVNERNTALSPSAMLNSSGDAPPLENYPARSSSGPTDSPPAIASLQSLLPPMVSPNFSHVSSPFEVLLTGADYPSLTKDPPPYPYGLRNGRPELTYATLNSVQPGNVSSNLSYQVLTSNGSAFEQNTFSYSQQPREYDEEVGPLAKRSRVDEGIGTSAETSPNQSNQSSPGMTYGDGSMNVVYSDDISEVPLFEPTEKPSKEVCTICGSSLTYKNGHYECESCNETPTPRPLKRKRKAQRTVSVRKEEVIICSNCRGTKTPLWRRDSTGLPLCNACGLYFKLHNLNRPLHMRKDTIQKRNRKPRNNGAKIPRRELQTVPSEARPVFTPVTNNTIPYSVPCSSNSVQPQYYIATTSAGPATSYQYQPFQFQNGNHHFVVNNPPAFIENSDQQYSMIQL